MGRFASAFAESSRRKPPYVLVDLSHCSHDGILLIHQLQAALQTLFNVWLEFSLSTASNSLFARTTGAWLVVDVSISKSFESLLTADTIFSPYKSGKKQLDKKIKQLPSDRYSHLYVT